jgi:SAM-dependent methyltransferase
MWRRFCPSAAIVHVPLGFVPELSRIAPQENEDIDVLFYGVINERRAKILRELQEWGLNVVAVTGKYGAERDALIARAKLVLNVHFYESKILEVSRLSYLLSNRKAVVSEFGADTESDIDVSSAVAAVPYEKLVDTCFQLAFDVEARRKLAAKGHEIFSRHNEAEILSTALAAVPAGSDVVELPKQINVGSGKKWNLEWLNLDTDSLWKPDLIADLNTPLPSAEPVDLGRFGAQVLPADFFEKIEASHVLEHVGDLVTAMTSFLRLLRVDGVLVIEVPYDLSYGAWQDPTHVRAFNERSWMYYTEWFWYLGWTEYRFEMVGIEYILSDYGRKLKASETSPEELLRSPRAIDAMRATFKKIPLTDGEKVRAKQRWQT